MSEAEKLYRLDHGILAGVCGDVTEYFNVDINLAHPIWAALYFAGTAGLWLYMAVALLLPKKSRVYPDWRGQRKIRYGDRPSDGRRASVIGIRGRH